MTIKKIFYLLSLFAIYSLFSLNQGYAQQMYTVGTYQISLPLGDTKEYTGNTSFRGIGFDFRYSVKKATTVGLSLGWNVFYERIRKTSEIKTEHPGSITGTQDRFLNAFPIMANVHYYFGEKRGIRPYIGLNAGGYYMLQRFEIGIISLKEDRWDWGIAPEAGIVFPVDEGYAIIINGKYNYAFSGMSPLGTDIKHSYLGINVGFVWVR
ncbi:outer membrane beta-barrel protein [bacterium BMS3Abin03]|jgi:hypothetical protein|nr:outer membrane beta-barrel protein [bacterium BMS3Abin03]MCG6960298.1 outer membrane beta-barrel protein [bacterium BMS3Abin03]